MKIYLITLFSIFSFYVSAQIITNEVPQTNTPKEEPEEKVKKERNKSKSGVEMFFGVSPAYTYRTLEINEGLFAQPIGERENEEGLWTVGYHLGVRTPLSNRIKLEIGAGYYANKEKNDVQSTDSILGYENTYQHISFPLRLVYSFGNEIKFYGGVGIIPKAFLSMSRKETTLDINNKETTQKYRERDNYNLFLLDGVVTIGAQFQLNDNYGIYASLEGRRQFTNNYNNQSPYIRKPYALGFNFGIEIYL